MRPKFVVPILATAILAIGIMVFMKSRRAASPAPVPVASVSEPPVPPPAPVSTPVVVKKKLTPEEQQAAVDAEKDRLYTWSMSSDPQALSNILGDLVSPQKQIRRAAIEAAKQFGDTNAIPVLKSLAANIIANSATGSSNAGADSDLNTEESAPDDQEATAMIEAADFIALPPVIWSKADPNQQRTPQQQQAIDANNARVEARRQAYLQKRNARQNTSVTFPGAQNPQASHP